MCSESGDQLTAEMKPPLSRLPGIDCDVLSAKLYRATGTDDDFAYTCKTLSSDPHAMYPSELALRPTKFFSFV